jgi:hypothetical protein
MERQRQPRVQLLTAADSKFLEQLLLDPSFSQGKAPKFVGESQPQLWANTAMFRKRVAEMDGAHCAALVAFILQRVHVILADCSSFRYAYNRLQNQ